MPRSEADAARREIAYLRAERERKPRMGPQRRAFIAQRIRRLETEVLGVCGVCGAERDAEHDIELHQGLG